MPSQLSGLRADFIVTAPQPSNPNDWVKLAQDKNPQLASARFNYEAAQQAVKNNVVPIVQRLI
jgi:hypothetical protein